MCECLVFLVLVVPCYNQTQRCRDCGLGYNVLVRLILRVGMSDYRRVQGSVAWFGRVYPKMDGAPGAQNGSEGKFRPARAAGLCAVGARAGLLRNPIGTGLSMSIGAGSMYVASRPGFLAARVLLWVCVRERCLFLGRDRFALREVDLSAFLLEARFGTDNSYKYLRFLSVEASKKQDPRRKRRLIWQKKS